MGMDNKIIKKMNALLNHASDEDKSVIYQIIEGIHDKNKGLYTTYITSFMKTNVEIRNKDLIMNIPISPFLHNSVDIVHGGFTATLADTAMGTLVNRKIPSDIVAVTSEMKLNYIAPGVGNELRCEAKILHLGSKTSVTEAKIYNDKGTLVVAASGSFYLIPRTKKKD